MAIFSFKRYNVSSFVAVDKEIVYFWIGWHSKRMKPTHFIFIFADILKKRFTELSWKGDDDVHAFKFF